MAEPDVNNMLLEDVQLEEGNLASMDAVQEAQGFSEMLQPGTYTFQLPPVIPGMNGQQVQEPWHIIPARPATAEYPASPARIQLKLSKDYALQIIASPDGDRNGEEINQSISNMPRKQTRGGVEILVNDLLFLLKKLGYTGPVPKTNREYIDLLARYGGAQFKTEVNVSWNCNDKRDVYMLFQKDPADPAKGTERKEVAGQKGCGTKHNPFAKEAARKIGKEDNGKFPTEIGCSKCGALVRGFANLALDRAV